MGQVARTLAWIAVVVSGLAWLGGMETWRAAVAGPAVAGVSALGLLTIWPLMLLADWLSQR